MTRKLLLTLLVVGGLGTLAGVGTFAAFSGSTQNSGNAFTAGTVTIGDNDSNAVLYNVTGQKPGQSAEKCIKVTYTGSLDADVKLFTTSSVNAGAQYINLIVEKGTSDTETFPSCGTFTSQSTLFNGTLQSFAQNKNSYENGILAFPGNATKWAQSDTLVYRFTLSVADNNSAQGADSGTHGFTFQAQNQ